MSREWKVKINQKEYSYPDRTSFLKIARDFQKDYEHDIVLVKENGKLRELSKLLKQNCILEFLTTQSEAGHRAYVRSLCLMMLKAMYYVVGKESIRKVSIHFTVKSGYFCTLDAKVPVTEELLSQVKNRMEELLARKIPLEKRTVDTEYVQELFRDYGMVEKQRLFRYRRSSRVNIYSMDEFEDYYYGYMVPNTSYLKYFDLKCYDSGFILRFPDNDEPEKLIDKQPDRKIFMVQEESLQWGKLMHVDTVGALNEQIVRHGCEEKILIQEALQEKKIADIATEIAKNSDKKLVFIAGPSSSGKTTFSHRLSIQLSSMGMRPHPIAVDNYFVNRDRTPRDRDGKPDYECLEALDVELFNRDMNRLLKGERVKMPRYNFKTGQREYNGDYEQLEENDVLVMEGIHCLNEKLSHSLPKENKFKIYISALTQLNLDEHNRIPTTDGRLIRRIIRDARTRGASAKQTISMWPSVRRGEEQYIFPFQEEADVMFNSALIYELSVLKVYVEPLLFGIDKTEPEYMEAKRLLKFLDYFIAIPADQIPANSLLREFVGGGCFQI